MVVFFRVDASIQIGSGHVMRCLTLANALKNEGANCTFICREHSGNILALIQSKGHGVVALPTKEANIALTSQHPRQEYLSWLGATPDEDAGQTIAAIQSLTVDKPTWLIVDHYALDRNWEEQLRLYCQKIMVIDDLADRQHDCDLLLDQTFGRDECDYQALVPEHCTILTGSYYALLRPEFAQWREYSLQRRQQPQLKQLLITLGGVDKDNVTGQVLTALATSQLPNDCQITIVMGEHAPWLKSIRAQAQQLPWPTEVKINVTHMAELMANSDFCIGAAGSTTWERCCLGLPTIQYVIAENQKKIATQLQLINAILWLKEINTINKQIILAKSYQKKLTFSCAIICDGQGTQKITKKIFNLNQDNEELRLHPISIDDNVFLKSLQTPEIRKFFKSSRTPNDNEHQVWFHAIYNSKESLIFLIEHHRKNVGMIRVDNINSSSPEISIIISPAYSGKGFGTSSLKKIIKTFSAQPLKATIHCQNTASIRTFEKVGFKKIDDKKEFFEYYLNI